MVKSLSNSTPASYKMGELMPKKDWIRIVIMVACSAYLAQRIYLQTKTLLENEMGFAEVVTDSYETKFPSMTFCPATLKDIPSAFHKPSNITADYENLQRLDDMLISVRQQMSINKYVNYVWSKCS